MVWRNVTTSDVTIFVFAQWRDVTKKIVFLLWRNVWRADLARGVTLFLAVVTLFFIRTSKYDLRLNVLIQMLFWGSNVLKMFLFPTAFILYWFILKILQTLIITIFCQIVRILFDWRNNFSEKWGKTNCLRNFLRIIIEFWSSSVKLQQNCVKIQ